MENLISQLHTHACEGNVDKLKECIEKCLEEGISLDEVDEYGWTALIKAAVNGQVEAMEVLIKAGADVNATEEDKNIMRLVRVASFSEKCILKVILFLIENGAGWNADVLQCAAQHGYLKLIDDCIAAGVSVEAVDGVGDTPLMTAGIYGQTEAMEVLIKAGADVNGVGGEESVLKKVINTTQSDEIKEKAIKILLRHGVDLASERFASTWSDPRVYERLIQYQLYLKKGAVLRGCYATTYHWIAKGSKFAEENIYKRFFDNMQLYKKAFDNLLDPTSNSEESFREKNNTVVFPREIACFIIEYKLQREFTDIVCQYDIDNVEAKEISAEFFARIHKKPYPEEKEKVEQEQEQEVTELSSRLASLR